MLLLRSLTTLVHTAVHYVWEVWTSRFVITLVMVVVWDAYQKYYLDTTSKQYDPPQHHSSSTVSATATDRASRMGPNPEERGDDGGEKEGLPTPRPHPLPSSTVQQGSVADANEKENIEDAGGSTKQPKTQHTRNRSRNEAGRAEVHKEADGELVNEAETASELVVFDRTPPGASIVVVAAATTNKDVDSPTNHDTTIAPRIEQREQEQQDHSQRSNTHTSVAAESSSSVVESSSSSPTMKKKKKAEEVEQPQEQQQQELQRQRRLTAAATLLSIKQFHYWYETETSLYRNYTLTRTDGVAVVPPYVPHSRRGTVPITLHVTNKTIYDITVYWVNYQGKYIVKGQIRKKGHVWTQTTWIDHPWVFEKAATATPLLYYVPYRVIPTVPTAVTIDATDGNGHGLHRFALIDGSQYNTSIGHGRNATTTADTEPGYHIGIDDAILPFPAAQFFRDDKPLDGVVWTLTHMSRYLAGFSSELFFSYVDTLQKYLWNIMHHPENLKYRHIRIASPKFQPLWQSPIKGLLLAIGFLEVEGYVVYGLLDDSSASTSTSTSMLSSERIQDLALLSYLVNEWKLKHTTNSSSTATATGTGTISPQQPTGATDGYGRAGFGRAGTMN